MCGMLIVGFLAGAWAVIDPLAGATYLELARVDGGGYDEGEPTEPFFILALGNDSRSAGGKGLGDSIHVIGVNPATRQATMLNVPRDTAGPGGGKINAAHSSGGLPGQVRALNEMMGIKIRYAITTDFPRFISMVDEIGGIDVNLPYALSDDDSGANLPAGPSHVDGHGALAISRDRKDFARQGDRQRTWNAGLVILSALSTLRTQSPTLASTLKNTAILARHVDTDNVSLDELYRLGKLALSIDPATVKNCTIPTGAGEGSNLSAGGAAQPLFADFRDDGVVANCEPVPGGFDTSQ